jgi:hypothetical protein
MIPAPVCDCGTRKEPTPKRAILLCPHCDHPCRNVDGCTRCRKYTLSVSHRIQSAA